MKRILLLILSVIPGVGPILVGRDVLGSLLLIGGLNFWCLAFIGFFLWIGPEGKWIGGLGLFLGLSSSIGSLVWTAIVTSPRRQQYVRAIANRALELALFAYLRGKLSTAQAAVEAGLRRARRDRDLLFVLWQMARETPDRGRARRLRRRLRHVDHEKKWEWEVKSTEEAHVGQSEGP